MPNIGLYTQETYPTKCNNTPIKIIVGENGCIELIYKEGGQTKSIKVCTGEWVLDAMYSTKFIVNAIPDDGFVRDYKISNFRASEVLKSQPLVFKYPPAVDEY